jgi:hypothetical protein
MDIEITDLGSRLQVQVLSRFATKVQYLQWTKEWLEACLSSPAVAGLYLDVLAAPPMRKELIDGNYIGPVGDPGGVESTILLEYDDRKTQFRRYSKRNWSFAMNQLEKMPRDVQLSMSRLDEEGNTADGEVTVKVERPLGNEWMTLELLVSRTAMPWLPVAELDLEMRRLGVEHAAITDASFAAVADDFVYTKTALEYAAKLATIEKWIPRSRECLRGYSWVTICPPEIAARMGGVEGLERTGTFVGVEELPNGAVVLQATERLDEYREDQVLAVFKTLASVLIPGLTMRLPSPIRDQRIVFDVDAADYRSASNARS